MVYSTKIKEDEERNTWKEYHQYILIEWHNISHKVKVNYRTTMMSVIVWLMVQ